MSVEKPSDIVQQAFDKSLDDATHAVLEAFAWCGLPEGDQLGALADEINDAIESIMRDWK